MEISDYGPRYVAFLDIWDRWEAGGDRMGQNDEGVFRNLTEDGQLTRRTLKSDIGAAGRASEAHALGADFQGGEA